ncbi:MAG TPA: fluoride efflux transporter CrcB [Polyangiaceae bacterium]|nr:fluoride efflux transporter CrcB [Polyangiaceae bacterium]
MACVERLFWVCLGSGLGGGARYLVSLGITRLLGQSFAYGTLTVNTIGSFLIGVLMYLGVTGTALSPVLRLALTTGVLGGFTTYSTFSYETFRYLQEGAWWTALVNVMVTLLGCLLATFLGWTLSKWLFAA